MLTSLKRLLGQRGPTDQERLDSILASLAQGWSLAQFDALKQLAEDGLATAQYELGRRFEQAVGVVQNLDDALLWYERAAEQGHLQAQAQAGLMLLSGPPSASEADASSRVGAAASFATEIHFQKDVDRAAHWNRLAAEGGDAGAQLRYGLQLAKGVGTALDLAAAKTWLQRSAGQGDVPGMTALGVLCMGGYGGTPDPASALPWLHRAAEAGDVNAKYWLGVHAGRPSAAAQEASASTAPAPAPSPAPVPAPAPTATPTLTPTADAPAVSGHDWLIQAAEKGHVPAMHQLGLAYWTGQQMPRDLSLAETWLRRAVSRHHVDAMRALAQMQLEQPGTDGTEAASLLWQAAEAGDAPSAALLGELYLEGRGVPRDTVEAARWLVAAGPAARPEAMTALAGLQAHGTDVDAGHGLARAWLEQAAQAGDLAAVFTLGSLYHRGLGVERDDGVAATWYQRAAERGSSAAAFYLGLLLADAGSERRDEPAALRWLQVASDRGYALAVCNWATMVYQGRGEAANTAKAVRILNRGIARGNLAATTMLAEWLIDGHHLPPDPQAAHALLQPALIIGDPLAAAIAAQLQARHGLPADTERLIELLTTACAEPRRLERRGPRAIAAARLALAQLLEARRTAPAELADARILELYDGAANDGLRDAQVWMLHHLESDPHLDDDPTRGGEARQYLLAAAARGDVGCLLRLSGGSERFGPFGAADNLPAIRFSGWMAAAITGDATAQRELAKLYLSGEGCQADPATAARWLARAVAQGDTEAAGLLEQRP